MKAIIPVYPEPYMLKTLHDLEGKTIGCKKWEEGFKDNSIYVYPERIRIDKSIEDIFRNTKEPIRVMSFSFIQSAPKKWALAIIYGRDIRPISNKKERKLIEIRTRYPERRATGRTY